MKKRLLSAAIAVVTIQAVSAQEFLQPSDSFSHNKISYVTLQDGTTIEGTLDDVDRKKGLIEEVTIKDANKKKHKLKAEKIKYMYLMPSNLNKMANALEAITEVSNYSDTRLNNALLQAGYVYFENANVQVKKNSENLLVQLLNPTFSSKIKVYQDPLAKETGGLSLAGYQLTGGDDKSYYFLLEGNPAALRIKKKDFDETLIPILEKCAALKAKYNNEIRWADIDKLVYDYTLECN